MNKLFVKTIWALFIIFFCTSKNAHSQDVMAAVYSQKASNLSEKLENLKLQIKSNRQAIKSENETLSRLEKEMKSQQSSVSPEKLISTRKKIELLRKEDNQYTVTFKNLTQHYSKELTRFPETQDILQQMRTAIADNNNVREAAELNWAYFKSLKKAAADRFRIKQEEGQSARSKLSEEEKKELRKQDLKINTEEIKAAYKIKEALDFLAYPDRTVVNGKWVNVN